MIAVLAAGVAPFTGCSLNRLCSSSENKFHESQCFESPGQEFSSHLQMSGALPTAFQLDSSSSFKEKLFYPQLCSAGTSTFAIYYHLTYRGWKQRKYLEMAKMYRESRQKYIFLLSWWTPHAVPCLVFDGVIHSSPWLHPAQARLELRVCSAGAEGPSTVCSCGSWQAALSCLRNYLQTSSLGVPQCAMYFIYICKTLFLEFLYWQQ